MPKTTTSLRFAIAAVFCAALAACGGGGGGGGPTINPPTNPPSSPTPSPSPCPSGYTGTPPNCTVVTTGSASVTVQAAPTTAPLPNVGGYAPESIALPGGSGTLNVTVSTQPPSGTSQLQNVYRRIADASRRTMSTGNSPYLYFTLTASGGAVTLTSLPGLNLTVGSTAPQDTNYRVAQWDATGSGWYDTGESVYGLSTQTYLLQLTPSSSPSTNAVSLAANQSIYLAVYHGTSVPSPAPQSVITGKVVDYDTQAAIAGATVQVVPLEAFQGTATPAPLVTATTAADGTFTTPSFTVQGHRTVLNGGTDPNIAVFVLPPSGSTTYTAAHTWLHATSGSNALNSNIPLVAMTSDEIAWLSQINADRQANGASANLTSDSYLLLAARWKAKDEQLGSYGCSHTTNPTAAYFTSIGGIGSPNENLACFGSVTWQDAEQSFMAEKGTPNDGHYLNIINSSNLFVGASVYSVPPSGSTGAEGTGVQEFLTTF